MNADLTDEQAEILAKAKGMDMDAKKEYREAFEAWFKTTRFDGLTGFNRKEDMFETWQACAAIAQPAQSNGVPEGWATVPVMPTDAQLDRAVSFALNVQISGSYNWSMYMRDVYLRMLAAAPQPPADTIAVPGLMNGEELSALRRFFETCDDFEADGYDVPKPMMKRLAEIGVVRRVTRDIYEATDYGMRVIESTGEDV